MLPLKYRRELLHWREFVRLAQVRIYGGWARLALLATGALPVLLAIILSALWRGSVDETSVLIGVLSTLFIVGLWTRFGLRHQVRDQGWILGDRQIVLTEQGFVDAGNGTELRVDWPAIEGISIGKTVIIFWMDRAAGAFIPREAFASADDERKFVDFAEARSRIV